MQENNEEWDKFSPLQPDGKTHNVARYGFGQPGGADPAEAARRGKPWSVRNAVRKLAAEEVNAEDPNSSKPKGIMTRAQIIAMRQLEKAMAGDSQAAMYVTDNVDGKLAQTISGDPENPLVVYGPLTEAERLARIAEICDSIRARGDSGIIDVTPEMGAVPGPTDGGLEQQG